jgi:flagellar hook-associated protein 3 FlgL
MLESILFGHEKGAFTGAVAAQPGKFELANGGTLLLDEIGELPLGLQAKLLRVLQEQRVERLGGRKEIELNVRIIAATNRDLQVEVAQGRFRADLMFRLDVLPLHISPLRERKEDVLPLARRFVAKYAPQEAGVATGERMLMPSDDPISAVRVLRIQREEATLTQYRTNIANVSGNLSKQEANLKAASDTMLNVRDLLLWAANGSNTSEDLAAIANEMGNLERTILSFANVRDEEGRYLFSGTLSDRPAITFDAATQSYQLTGNDQYRQAAVANGVLVEENVTAAQVFGGGVGMLNDLNALVKMLADPALDANDPAVQASISTTLNSLDKTHGDLLGAVSELGGRQNTLTLLSSSNEDVSLVNQKIDGELSQLDYASASIDLNNYQLSLQATQKTYLKINGLSLFGML